MKPSAESRVVKMIRVGSYGNNNSSENTKNDQYETGTPTCATR